MKPYLDIVKNTLENGHDHPDRTGVGRRSIFGTQTRFNLKDGFPLVTTRKVFTKGLIIELLWFIKGSCNVKELQDNGVNIWNQWAVTPENILEYATEYSEGKPEIFNEIIEEIQCNIDNIGPMYGAMWRNAPQPFIRLDWPIIDFKDIPKDKVETYQQLYNEYLELAKENPDLPSPPEGDFEHFARVMYNKTIDQLNDLILNLKTNPYSARHVVNAWIPSFLPFEHLKPQYNVILGRGALAPCHMCFQCFVLPPLSGSSKPRLSMQMYQRSVDLAVGAPYNIAQYSLLLHMIAQVVDMEAHEFIWTTGDTHLYANHIESVEEQLQRDPLPLPKLWLNPDIKSIFDFRFEDIRIEDYQSHPVIHYPVAT
jgi:thymidylate synthase